MTAASLAPLRWLARAGGAGLGCRYPFVLCYHGVGPVAARNDAHGLFVSRELFLSHLDTIEASGHELVSVGELWRQLHSGAGAAGKGSITFDDALAKTVHEAVPVLLERGMGCSVFVPTGLIGAHHPDVPGERILSAGEIRELAAEGVEIGAHSADHIWLPGLSHAKALDQLRRSRAVLEDLLGRPVRTMAYPYGGHDAGTVRAAEEAGYEVACGCSGAGPQRWHALSVPREPIHPSATPLRLRIKMAGLYGPAHALVGDAGLLGRRRAARRRPQAPARTAVSSLYSSPRSAFSTSEAGGSKRSP